MKTAMPRSHGLRWLPFTAALLLIGAVTLPAQVVPATPKKFTKRGLGGGSASINPGGAPATPRPPVVRTTTYMTLSDSRQWTSADGKPLLAKLVAFEDVTVETRGNSPQATAPPPIPANLTVVRDGKARLLSGQTPYEVPLDRLSQADRDFIESIRAAMVQKAAGAPVAPEKK
jgi:hypothetical protein